jgi:nucleoside-diphosphate-sugar epimerase
LAWARLFYLYGPGEAKDRLIAQVIRSLLLGERARVTDAPYRRDYLYVEDAAEAVVALVARSFDGAVNIGSGQAVTVQEIARMAAHAVEREELLLIRSPDARRDEPSMIEADIKRIHSETGWSPLTPLEHGLRATVEWWRTHYG